MSITFTKLFSSITESTVWYEPDATRLVWITMMAMADKRGRIWASILGLAGRARVDVEACRRAINAFLSPDPDSRTKDYEGRRIEEIDGGWRLLNYEKYRAMRDEENRKEYKRDWIRKRRQMSTNVDKVDRGRPPYTQAEAEAEKIQIGQTPSAFDRFWAVYPKKVKRKTASEIWRRKQLDSHLEELLRDVTRRLAADRSWKEGYIPHPPTYLNQERWRDELEPVREVSNGLPFAN